MGQNIRSTHPYNPQHCCWHKTKEADTRDSNRNCYARHTRLSSVYFSHFVGAEVHHNNKTNIKSSIHYNLLVLAELVNVYDSAQTDLFCGIAPQNEVKLGLNVLGIKADITISRLQVAALNKQS